MEKKHVDQVCDNINDWSRVICEKRNSQICRNYSTKERCRFKGGCAYLHKKKADNQEILNQQLKDLMMKHETEIKILTQEVSILKDLVQK